MNIYTKFDLPNVEFLRVILIYCNMFKFQVDGTIIFLVTMNTDAQIHADRHTEGHEYSIAAVNKL